MMYIVSCQRQNINELLQWPIVNYGFWKTMAKHKIGYVVCIFPLLGSIVILGIMMTILCVDVQNVYEVKKKICYSKKNWCSPHWTLILTFNIHTS
jgi:hypothetical protein